ncbi:MAG: hypothetical protein ABDK92_08085 [Atribacterota bacterium]
MCCREAFGIMEKEARGGRIINLGSTLAKLAFNPGTALIELQSVE